MIRNTNDPTEMRLNMLLGMAIGGAGMIEAQERSGQAELVASEQLPVKGSDHSIFQKWGFQWGETTPGDSIFRSCTLPAGWSKQRTDHSMWSNIVDDKGRVRASVFYKAAYYDRSAHINPEHRFQAQGEYDSDGHATGRGVVKDGKDTIWTSDPIDQAGLKSYEVSEAARAKAVEWLNANRPGWAVLETGWNLPD